jgi:phosphoglycolate phosphatase-like HAD superfamily hydrolase
MTAALLDDCDALIFDFDGVLVESTDIKITAFREMYREHGPDVEAAAIAHHVAHGGISRRQKIRHVHRHELGIQLSPDALDALCQRFSLLVEEAVTACDPVPGADALLDAHHRRLPTFIVSGTPQPELTRIVGRRGLEPYFTEVFGSPPEKPPIIRDILARHRLDNTRVVFIGDAMTDYDAARETGVRFIGRVPPGADNPFPDDAAIVPDMMALLS